MTKRITDKGGKNRIIDNRDWMLVETRGIWSFFISGRSAAAWHSNSESSVQWCRQQTGAMAKLEKIILHFWHPRGCQLF